MSVTTLTAATTFLIETSEVRKNSLDSWLQSSGQGGLAPHAWAEHSSNKSYEAEGLYLMMDRKQSKEEWDRARS